MGLVTVVAAAGSACGTSASSHAPSSRPRTHLDAAALRTRSIALSPIRAGVYQYSGVDTDSHNPGTRTPFTALHSVEAPIIVGGVVEQRTEIDSDGKTSEYASEYLQDGICRIHDSDGVKTWWYKPPLLTVITPLRVGATWTARTTSDLPDVNGAHRVTDYTSTNTVTGTADMTVDGQRIAVFVITASSRVTVTDTSLATGAVSSFIQIETGTSTYSPETNLEVTGMDQVITKSLTGKMFPAYTTTDNIHLDKLEPIATLPAV